MSIYITWKISEMFMDRIMKKSILKYLKLSYMYNEDLRNCSVYEVKNEINKHFNVNEVKKSLTKCCQECLCKSQESSETTYKIKLLIEMLNITRNTYIDLIILFTNDCDDILQLVYEPFLELLKSYPVRYFKVLIFDLHAAI